MTIPMYARHLVMAKLECKTFFSELCRNFRNHPPRVFEGVKIALPVVITRRCSNFIYFFFYAFFSKLLITLLMYKTYTNNIFLRESVHYFRVSIYSRFYFKRYVMTTLLSTYLPCTRNSF